MTGSCTFWGLSDNIIVSVKEGLFDHDNSDLYLSDDYLIITNPMDPSLGPSGGLVIADISDPENMVFAGSIADTGSIAIKDNILYSLSYGSLLEIYDISDPANPAKISEAGITSSGNGICINDNLLYCGGLSVLDISDPNNPAVLGTYDFSGIDKLLMEEDRLYGSRGSTLSIFDISSPELPVLLKSVTLRDNSGNSIEVYNSVIYIPQNNMVSGFYAIDTSNIENLVFSEKIEISRVWDIARYDDILYMASGQWDIYPRIARYLISDPFNPRRLYSTGTVPEENIAIECNQDYIYLLTSTAVYACVRQENKL